MKLVLLRPQNVSDVRNIWRQQEQAQDARRIRFVRWESGPFDSLISGLGRGLGTRAIWAPRKNAFFVSLFVRAPA
ncbi:hypothetical protein TWF225_005852 [Orbilia oligospora]|uniref:Uncharacterized protein n=1 Tax=Orbilia oligospora TaxID=2813651 RepID=A0A7C8PIN4_ORBOL|nr:hypothetical protein TWF751_005076 [Orbilia oligospora]KAF3184951.1 hypothetical protein TWF225_005852 [Orbilia oligospora]KAF3271213.1 hypothetical protein TWF217_005622 [Orbilia oligospora]KAF3271763.1 hypothetical protein TWF128_000307 [Orbilia oligospora]KAF3293648.1 hypothetical protein TWF132_004608 [Orbilia oligospora]